MITRITEGLEGISWLLIIGAVAAGLAGLDGGERCVPLAIGLAGGAIASAILVSARRRSEK